MPISRPRPLIEAVGAGYRYPGGAPVLNSVDLSLLSGHLTAIVGPNGGGKTTLGKLLAGILKPTSGSVRILGEDTRRLSLGQIGEHLGYLFQEPDRQLFTTSVEEELSFVPRLRGIPPEQIRRDVAQTLRRFQLSHLREAFPFDLSRGEKQRLALAAIMINEPSYLILDEPTTALDPRRKGELLSLLVQMLDRGVGMMVISHDRDFVAETADRLLVVDGGEVTDASDGR
ncbi:MAG: ABC transporter ATP-binding protein [Bacillota bacterium]